MILVKISDFVGQFNLVKSTKTNPDIQAYIDQYEKKYILELLGVELGLLFIADVQEVSASDPIETRFQALIDEFDEQDDFGKIYSSKGIKQMLIAFIYFHYILEDQVKVSTSGAVKDDAETSKVLNPRAATRMAEKRWNAALDTAEAIQWLCAFKDPDTYPEFKGVVIPPQYSSLI